MEIPLSIILYAYLALATLFVFFSLFLIYHALKFGTATALNSYTILIYLAVATAIMLAAYFYIARIDWQAYVVIF